MTAYRRWLTASFAIITSLMQQIRNMDKLVDELAKGRPMDKILRK